MLKSTLESLLREWGYNQWPAWLEAALSLTNLILILLLAWVSLRVTHRLVSAFHQRLKDKTPSAEEQRRIATLERVFGYVASVVIWVVTIMLVLSELGISIAPILATAGVAGLAVGFGAQSLVKDYFTGFVMLVENQIRVGDIVEIADKTGAVEELTLRYVRLRDYSGSVHFVPNGIITSVSNMSRDFAFAVVDVGVGYREELGVVFQVMKTTAEDLRADSEFSGRILDGLEIAGVDQWAESSVMIRARLKVVALEQWTIRREYLRRLKMAFDAHGIDIPYPHRTVVQVPAEARAQLKSEPLDD
ncbi:MAG: mechanosensitive ion channel family protein [Burkholderiaceae bacterium]|jgi:small-conductance mechanosensitive channel